MTDEGLVRILFLRKRAVEVREMSDIMHNDDARKDLLEIAARYDSVADAVECWITRKRRTNT